jgi:hypothetical protein
VKLNSFFETIQSANVKLHEKQEFDKNLTWIWNQEPGLIFFDQIGLGNLTGIGIKRVWRLPDALFLTQDEAKG